MSDEATMLAVKIGKVETEISTHKDECARRYEEGNQRIERLFTYIKDAHESTNKKLEGATVQIASLSDQIAETRGASKMGKWIAGGIATAAGFVGGLGGHVIIK